MPKPIADETLKAIRTMYEIEPNKAKLARAFNVSPTTIYKALGKIDPEEQRERRREGMGRIAENMVKRIEDIVAGLEIPEDASYMQRATVAGILTDKVEKLDKRLEDSKREDEQAAAPIPETIEALAGAIRNEIRSISFVLDLKDHTKVIEEVRVVEAEIGQPLMLPIQTMDDLDGGPNA